MISGAGMLDFLACHSIEKLVIDAEAIASAIGRVQQAKASFEEAQQKALRAAGLVTREDFKSAGKRLSQLKRRCAELSDELDQLLSERK